MSGLQVHITLSCKAYNFCFTAEFGLDGGALFSKRCSNPSKAFRLGLRISSVMLPNVVDTLLTSILPLLVTALRITPLCASLPGVTGIPSVFSKVDFSVPSSLSLPEICNWLAAQDILSRRARDASDVISLPKYPLFMSTLRIVGGDFELGLTIELPLPLLELFLLLPFWDRRRAKFMREFTAGDGPTQPFPGLGCGAPPKGPFILFTCGVVRMESSMSSASIRTSSSELLLDDSDIIILTLPKELETVIRSAFAMVDPR